MKVDNPNAFRFIMQDELYLLKDDKAANLIDMPPANKQAIAPAQPGNETEQKASPIEQIAVPVTEITAAAPATPSLAIPVSKPAPVAPESVLKTPESAFNYLGNNNKQFAILVSYPAEQHIPAAHLTALESMLKRKDLSLDDVAIFNVHQHQPLPMAKVAELLRPVKMVIMGKDALPQGIGNLPLNSSVQGRKTHVLYSFSFDEMMSSNDNKKAFWDQMKTL